MTSTRLERNKMDKRTKTLLEYLITNEVRKQSAAQKLVEGANLYNIFVQPITDIFDTTKAELQKTGHTIASNVGMMAKTTAMMLAPYIPGVTDAQAMSRVKREHKDNLVRKIEEIDSRYADVFERNWNAIASSDLGPLLFLANPQMALGAMFLTKGASLGKSQAVSALEGLDSFLGGNETVRDAIEWLQGQPSQLRQAVDRTARGGHSVDPFSMDGYGGRGYDDGGYYMEQAAPQAQQQAAAPKQAPQDYSGYVQKILKDPKIQQALNNSQIAQAMQQTAIDAIVSNASSLLSFSFEDLKKNAGGNYQKIIAQLQKNPGMENKNPEQDQQFKDLAVKELKALIKKRAIDQLNALAQTNRQLAPMVKSASDQIQKL